jgi:hypothetical protein
MVEDVSRKQLLAEIARLYNKLGKEPSYQDMNDHGGYSVYTYPRVFGSWNDTVESVGSVSRLNPTSRLNDELLAELESG